MDPAWNGERRALSGMLGHGNTLSPPLHEAEAAALGMRLIYSVVDTQQVAIEEGGIAALIRHAGDLGYTGLNVTYPYKALVRDAIDDLAPSAAAANAVNTIVFDGSGRTVGHNTDGDGFGAGVDDGLPNADLARVVQFGAGGAGSATAVAVLARGAETLTLVDPDVVRAAELRATARKLFPDRQIDTARPVDAPDALAACTGIINASAIGTLNAPGSPVDDRHLHAGLWVADVVYSPLETPLLLAASRAGAATLDGGRMLVHQAALSFELFHALRPDIDRMRRHFLALVEQRRVA